MNPRRNRFEIAEARDEDGSGDPDEQRVLGEGDAPDGDVDPEQDEVDHPTDDARAGGGDGGRCGTASLTSTSCFRSPDSRVRHLARPLTRLASAPGPLSGLLPPGRARAGPTAVAPARTILSGVSDPGAGPLPDASDPRPARGLDAARIAAPGVRSGLPGPRPLPGLVRLAHLRRARLRGRRAQLADHPRPAHQPRAPAAGQGAGRRCRPCSPIRSSPTPRRGDRGDERIYSAEFLQAQLRQRHAATRHVPGPTGAPARDPRSPRWSSSPSPGGCSAARPR